MNQTTNLAIDWVEQGRVPDAFIRAALRFTGSPVLYGRQNTLSGSDGLPLAEIVEILPPA